MEELTPGEMVMEQGTKNEVQLLNGRGEAKMRKKVVLLTFLLIHLSRLEGFVLKESEETPFLFEQPLLITSAGQSAEVLLASVLAKRAGLNYSLSKFATSKDLENVKTLVLVLGASLKGPGEAGLDTNQEKERVSSLLREAQKKNIPLLCLHLGGESRRGQQTDEMIFDFLPLAKMVIVVKSGNKDGIFSKISKERNIPLIEVLKTADAVEPLKQAFKRASSAHLA